MIFILALLIIFICLLYFSLKPHHTAVHRLKVKPLIKTQPQTTTLNPHPLSQLTESLIVPQALINFRLISKEECEQKTIDEIIVITQSIPRPHSMLKALTREIDNSEKLYELVKSDPEIAAKNFKNGKLLKLLFNSKNYPLKSCHSLSRYKYS